MKKTIIFCSAFFLFVSCQKKTEQPVNVETEVAAPQIQSEPTGNKNLVGYSLINSSDCLSCHKNSETFVGPSYAAIAEKYTEADTEMLASKIIDGGSGNWGDIPMQPHPNLSKEDAKKMVEYILSMKK